MTERRGPKRIRRAVVQTAALRRVQPKVDLRQVSSRSQDGRTLGSAGTPWPSPHLESARCWLYLAPSLMPLLCIGKQWVSRHRERRLIVSCPCLQQHLSGQRSDISPTGRGCRNPLKRITQTARDTACVWIWLWAGPLIEESLRLSPSVNRHAVSSRFGCGRCRYGDGPYRRSGQAIYERIRHGDVQQ